MSSFVGIQNTLNHSNVEVSGAGYKTQIQNAFSLTGDIRIFTERAGLGSKGANELILNPQYGPNLLFAALFTDNDLMEPSPTIDMVCINCHRCWEWGVTVFIRFR